MPCIKIGRNEERIGTSISSLNYAVRNLSAAFAYNVEIYAILLEKRDNWDQRRFQSKSEYFIFWGFQEQIVEVYELSLML